MKKKSVLTIFYGLFCLFKLINKDKENLLIDKKTM